MQILKSYFLVLSLLGVGGAIAVSAAGLPFNNGWLFIKDDVPQASQLAFDEPDVVERESSKGRLTAVCEIHVGGKTRIFSDQVSPSGEQRRMRSNSITYANKTE